MSRFVVLTFALLTGCVSNAVHQLLPDSVAKSKHAVLVYGIGVEGKWGYPQFAVQLAEYSVKDQTGAGNCYVFNRAEAAVPSTPGPVKYFAFEVPAGHYVYSAFNAAPVIGETFAFNAVEGRAAYIGDFVFTSAKHIELRRNSESLESALPEVFHGMSGKFNLAEAVQVRPPKMFLCGP